MIFTLMTHFPLLRKVSRTIYTNVLKLKVNKNDKFHYMYFTCLVHVS